MKMVLVVRSPQPFPNPGNGAGEVAVVIDGHELCRKMVPPGTIFTGTEGRFHPGTAREENTGWYQPVEFWTVDEAVQAVASSLWDEENRPWTDESRRQMAEAIVAQHVCNGPGDFPGLADHYPDIAGQALAERLGGPLPNDSADTADLLILADWLEENDRSIPPAVVRLGRQRAWGWAHCMAHRADYAALTYGQWAYPADSGCAIEHPNGIRLRALAQKLFRFCRKLSPMLPGGEYITWEES